MNIPKFCRESVALRDEQALSVCCKLDWRDRRPGELPFLG
jgi:hypothetical protein